MKKILLSLLLLLIGVAGVNAQAKKAKRDTLYTITASRLHIVDGKPTSDFTIYNLKWADTLWNVSRDLDMEQPNLAIKNYRWYFYDANKRLNRFERYINEKLDRRILYRIESNLLAQREHFQLNGTDTVLTRKDVITNDANGRASKIKVYDGKGKSIASLSYSYDAKGNEVKMKASMKVILDADSTFSRQTTYTYDSLGRVAKKMVKSVKADKQKENILYAYTYNKEGKLESTTRYDEMGKMLGKEEIVYYSGRISQRKYYNSEGVLTENLAFRYRKFGASLDNNMY
ncbi:hypothetical protein [Alistipes sp. ZOR0009]|uniref:hypothetical protein n=1 Tax=Alistipes sp. ZOR0009 TaxID=1339253 RepID=UPI00064821DC|nr:hypothetical protein [Alistipes sp. ZOR0009]